MAQSSRRSKKGLLNNPLIVILLFLLMAVVAAIQFGLLDKFLGATANSGVGTTPSPKPAPPSAQASPQGPVAGAPALADPKAQPAATSNTASQPSATRPDAKTPAANPAAQQQAPAAIVQSASGTLPAVQSSKTTAPEPPKPKYQVPDFAFDVGRDNPFQSFPGDPSKTAAAPTYNTNAKPQTVTSATTNPPPSKPVSQGASGNPAQTWRYLGTNSFGPIRFAIIETPSTSYIVKVGDRVEGVWVVTEITRERVVLASAKSTMTLVLGGEKK